MSGVTDVTLGSSTEASAGAPRLLGRPATPEPLGGDWRRSLGELPEVSRRHLPAHAELRQARRGADERRDRSALAMTARDRMVLSVVVAVSPRWRRSGSCCCRPSATRPSPSTARSARRSPSSPRPRLRSPKARSPARSYPSSYATLARLCKAVPTDPQVPSLIYELNSAAQSQTVASGSQGVPESQGVAFEGIQAAGASNPGSAPPRQHPPRRRLPAACSPCRSRSPLTATSSACSGADHSRQRDDRERRPAHRRAGRTSPTRSCSGSRPRLTAPSSCSRASRSSTPTPTAGPTRTTAGRSRSDPAKTSSSTWSPPTATWPATSSPYARSGCRECRRRQPPPRPLRPPRPARRRPARQRSTGWSPSSECHV